MPASSITMSTAVSSPPLLERKSRFPFPPVKVWWLIWGHLSAWNTGRPLGFYQISTTKKTRISTKYRPHSILSTKHRPLKFLKKRVLTHFATKVQMFIRAGLYPTSQEIHIKQGAGTYLHITSFNGRVIHFLNPEIHHISNNRENLSPFWEILMKYRPF